MKIKNIKSLFSPMVKNDIRENADEKQVDLEKESGVDNNKKILPKEEASRMPPPAEKTTEAAKTGVRSIFTNIIQPDERNLKNYFDINFWVGKRQQYVAMREKERQDLNVYEVLSQGAYPSIEYYILTILSCIIATTGLLQGSTATIIGAMIVAPLMTPILAFSLGIIWGDAFLIKTSLKSLIKGTFIAIIISAVIAFAIPTADYSSEILSRTQPSIFDIIVALVSGIVGAYGYSNKNISATLVGIAIAVALMPPLCTVGIGIGTLNPGIAGGAAVLFVINLVSISLSGAVVFWLMKIHPRKTEESQVRKRALYQIVISIIILTCIAVPVGYFMREGFLMNKTKKAASELILKELPGARIIQIQHTGTGDSSSIDVILSVTDLPSQEMIDEIKNVIKSRNAKLKNIDIRLLHVSKPRVLSEMDQK